MVTLQAKFQLGCVIFAGLGAFLASRTLRAIFQQSSFIFPILWGTGFLLSSFTSLAFWDIQSRRPANSHNFRSFSYQYLLFLFFNYFYKRALKRFQGYSRTVKEVQEKTLLNALEFDKGTVYGMKYEFSKIKTLKEYVERVPLTTYKDIEPFIDRIAKGEKNVLTSRKIIALSRSSGTSGKPKLIPSVRGNLTPTIEAYVLGLGSFYIRHEFKLGRVLGLRYKCKIDITEGGLRAAPVSQIVTPYHPHFLSPRYVYDVMDQTTSYYLHAVFGLQDKEVVMIDAMQAPIALVFFRTLETHWKDICNDIATGKLRESLKLSREQRQLLNSLLNPNAERAQELVKEFEVGFTGIGPRVWPGLTCAWICNTGSFAVQAKILADVYLKGIYQFNSAHHSSEGLMGINMATKQEVARKVLYNFWLNGIFYEFIPAENIEEENPETLFLHELTLGGMYEIVLTNCKSLYRYRLGDVIKIVDFQNQAPVYEFQYRVGQLLNLNVEKTTEKQFTDAVADAMATLSSDVLLVDFTTTDTTITCQLDDDFTKSVNKNSEENDCYVLIVELEQDGKPYKLNEAQRAQFDACLQVANHEYGEHRKSGLIGPMIVYQVALGTFYKLQCLITTEYSTMQYKTSRMLRKKEVIKMLIAQSIS